MSAGGSLSAATRAGISLSLNRSAPSTMRKRRPIAKVIAFNAAATFSGVAASPSKSSTPLVPDWDSARVRRRARRSAMRP